MSFHIVFEPGIIMECCVCLNTTSLWKTLCSIRLLQVILSPSHLNISKPRCLCQLCLCICLYSCWWFGMPLGYEFSLLVVFIVCGRELLYPVKTIINIGPWSSDYAIAINYFMLYSKYYIYLEKLDYLGYLCYHKYILKIEKGICNRNNQIAKFDQFNTIFENLKYVAWLSMFIC